MDTHFLSLLLGILGPVVIGSLILWSTLIYWRYHGIRRGSFQWQLRNWRLKQLATLACLFSLAMAASYGVLGEAWAWVYLIIGFKAGTWWIRFAISQRA